MKAEVLFRNFSDRKLHMVRYYLHMSCFFFDQMEDELEVLITYSKILRVRFAEMLQDGHQALEFDYVLDTHFEYLEVMKGLEKYIKKQSDESPRIKKAIMQFVEFAKYYNLPLEGYDKFI